MTFDPYTTEPTGKSCKVLLVDDEQLALDLLQKNLLRRGYEVDTALNGIAALDRIDAGYTVLVTDIIMPEMDGISLVKHVKQRYAHVMCIAVTSFADKDRAIAALNAGADYLLEKPFTVDVLSALIERLVRESKKHVQDHIGSAVQGNLQRFDLNESERQLVMFMLKGLANKQIAYELGVKEQTVKNRMSHIFKKLNISGRSDVFTLLFSI